MLRPDAARDVCFSKHSGPCRKTSHARPFSSFSALPGEAENQSRQRVSQPCCLGWPWSCLNLSRVLSNCVHT